MKQNVIITMGGNSSRFKKAGYNIPKYMISAKDKTLFEWSISSLRQYINSRSRFIFIVKKEDNAADFIAQQCQRLDIVDYYIIEMAAATDGQATTAIFAESHIDTALPVGIYNIDTFVDSKDLPVYEGAGDGWIPCFKGTGDGWSFVKLGAGGIATEVREKQRISDNCTLGFYWFRSFALYKKLYDDYYGAGANLEKGEKYIAPLYNQLISYGKEVYISKIDNSSIIPLGTPEELNLFLGS